jgi:hypothetical protein
MEAQVTFEYDCEGAILYINTRLPALSRCQMGLEMR